MPGVGEYVRIDESALVAKYLPMAKRVVRRYFSYADGVLTYDDLDQEAAVALLEAIRAYDPSQNGPLEPFAIRRIRWRVLDYVRQQLRRAGPRQPAPRQDAASDASDGDAEHAEAGGDEGSATSCVEEVALWDRLRQQIDIDPAPTEAAAVQSVMAGKLAEAIGKLPLEDQQLLGLYWTQELTYEEIAHVVGSTKPTIGRRHQRILRTLAEALGGSGEGGDA